MIVQVEGQSAKPFRTAGNPVKLSAYQDIDPQQATKAPGLNQHREAILAEVMADAESYEQSASVHIDLDYDTTQETNPWTALKDAV